MTVLDFQEYRRVWHARCPRCNSDAGIAPFKTLRAPVQCACGWKGFVPQLAPASLALTLSLDAIGEPPPDMPA